MRPTVLIAGVVLVALGFVLGYFPGPSAEVAGGAVTVDVSAPLQVGGLPLAFLTPGIHWSARWNATEIEDIAVFACGTDSSCGHVDVNSTPVTNATGTSGTLTWTGSAGQYFAIYTTGPTQVSLSYQAPLLGGLLAILLIAVGGVLVIIGVLPKHRLPLASPPAAPPS